MKLVGLLSWFDEEPAFLERAIASYAGAGMLDALVALDGRYALYGSRTTPCVSEREQYDAIRDTCAAHDVALMIGGRDTPWEGEVHKRTELFRHGLALAEIGRDWFWVIDGDNELMECDDSDAARARLASTEEHVAEVILSEPGRMWQDLRRPMRQLFRALPGFAPYGRHWYYVAQVDGEYRYLWGPAEKNLVPAIELHGLVVRHHHVDRDQARRNAAYTYYAKRDERGVETSPSWVFEDSPGRVARVDNEGELV